MTVEAKGIAIITFAPFIKEKFGQNGYVEWLEALGPGSRAILSGQIDSGRWYPMDEACSHPTETLCRVFYGGDPKGAWDLGRYSADHAFNWFFRSVIKLTTVQNFVMRASSFLSSYYHPVSMEMPFASPGRILVHIIDFSESSRYIEHRIAGWTQRALEIHGCTEVRVLIAKSRASGDPYTEMDITWIE